MKHKIVYTDDNCEKAIFGEIVSEDDFFYDVIDKYGSKLKIGKKAVVLVKYVGGYDVKRS